MKKEISGTENSADKQVRLGKPSSSEGKRRRKMEELIRFDRFAEEQGGTYTAQMVCAVLMITLQGVDYAARTGGIKFVTFGRLRFFGKKSVYNYRWSLSRKFKDNPRMTFSPGQADMRPIPGMPEHISNGSPAPDFKPSRRPGVTHRETDAGFSSPAPQAPDR